MSETEIMDLYEKARSIREGIIRSIAEAGSGHPGGSLSIAEILAVLYFREMRIDPQNPSWDDRDRLVLSKGHAAPALYAALAERGFFPREELLSLRKFGSRLQGHPDMKRTPGVEMSTGSLGQGLSAANGMALRAKLDGKDYRVYVLLGDGELEEGQIWEAAMTSVHRGLGNLTAFVDYNGLQIDGPISDVKSVRSIAGRFASFGWNVIEIDGHDIEAIVSAIEEARGVTDRPTAIIAHTLKGRGVPFMEGQVEWHGKAPSREQAREALLALGAQVPPVPIESARKPAADGGRRREATREAYGKALVELGKLNPNVVVLDADLSKSTKTDLFAKEFPERFFQMGISEQDMISTAAGLAASGKIPFASSFAVFAAGRAFDQIRQVVGYTHLNVKIAATHAGITVGEDGASHQSVEDVALMRAVPGMTVIVPADAVETRKAVLAAAKHNGPVYLRLGRAPVPVIFDDDYEFEIGKAAILRDGSDVTLVASGVMVEAALDAADLLDKEGVRARVINMHTIKPLDTDALMSAASETGAIVTAEEHSVIGGLGGAVAEFLVCHNPVPMEIVGIKDAFGQSGKPGELLDYYGLTSRDIADAARRVLARKG